MSVIEDKAPSSLEPLGLRELTEILIKHYGLSEGQFDLLVNFQVGAGIFGPTPQQSGPGLAVSVSQIGLAPAQNPNDLSVDAAKVKGRKRKPSAE